LSPAMNQRAGTLLKSNCTNTFIFGVRLGLRPTPKRAPDRSIRCDGFEELSLL
jgi:hypothetical protein